MCFSAQASFAGGVIISAIGVFTIRKVHKPSQIIFASIPLFFGLQQIAEGILWIALPLGEYEVLQKTAAYTFLVMAQVIWPVMIPLSVLFMEENEKKKKILKGLLLVGIILSIYYASCLLFCNVHPQIKGYHIQYNNDFPVHLMPFSFILYLTSTITPLFVSGIKRTHLMGILMAFSCLVTAIFFSQYLTSVWCFFAALLSCVVYWILSDSKKQFILEKLLLLKKI